MPCMPYMSKKLDELDKKILNAVQEDVSQPKVSLLAKKIGKPVTTIHQRLKRLEKEGLIKGYFAKIDPYKIDKPLVVWMLLAFESKQDFDVIGKKLSQMSAVQEVHFVSGIYAFLLKIRVKEVNEYYQISTQKIQQIPGIVRVEGLISYKTFSEKDSFLV